MASGGMAEEKPPAEKCGGQNAEDGPRQVAENRANLLNPVAEDMAQPDEEGGSERLTQNVPQSETEARSNPPRRWRD